MSDFVSRGQTPWEETDEEVQRRRAQSQSPDTGWAGTSLGLALAASALVALFWLR